MSSAWYCCQKHELQVDNDTVWLNRSQLAELFDRDVKTIGKHINNALKEELNDEVAVTKFATTTQHGAMGKNCYLEEKSICKLFALELNHDMKGIGIA